MLFQAESSRKLALKCCIILLTTLWGRNLLFAQQQGQERNIPIPSRDYKKKELIKLIHIYQHLALHWKPDDVVDPDQVLHGDGRLVSLDEAMRILMGNKPLKWGKGKNRGTIYIEWVKPFDNNKPVPPKKMDNIKVRLDVVDEGGQPLAYASIYLQGHHKLLVAGADGGVTINLQWTPDTAVCTYVGKKPDSILLVGRKDYVVSLRPVDAMQEVFVKGGYTFLNEIPRTNAGDRTLIKRDVLSRPVSDVLGALEGRAPGLEVSQRSDVHGAMPRVEIRGNMSILNGHAPLFVIDGVPMAVGGRSMSNINSGSSAGDLNPFSFYSGDIFGGAEVLKDADATAIYGAKGANGVILLTTKQAMAGKPRWSAGIETGFSLLGRQPALFKISDYVAMRREAFKNDDTAMTTDLAGDILSWDTTRSVNWQKQLIGEWAHTTRAHISLTGGKPRDSYFIGASSLREENVFITRPAHELLNVFGRWNHGSRDARLRSELAGLMGWDVNHQFITDITKMQFLAPDAPDLLGSDGKPVYSYRNVNFFNPWGEIGNPYTARSAHQLVNENLQYQLQQDVLLKLNAGWNKMGTSEYSEAPIRYKKPGTNTEGNSDWAYTQYSGWIFEPQIEYTLKREPFKVRMLGGGSWQGTGSSVWTRSATGFTNDQQLRNAALAKVRQDTAKKWSDLYSALYGRVQFDWMDNRSLDLSFRRDRSSRYADGRRNGFFWATGVGWVFSDEPFFWKAPELISYGKLRASYGITGNDQLGQGFSYLDRISSTSGLTFRVLPSGLLDGKLSPEVTWETIRKMEVSLEMGFRDNKQSFTISWYRHRSDHQLLPDLSVGMSDAIVLRNWPVALQNSGWEISLSSRNIDSRHFTWTTSLNASLPVSRVLSFDRRLAGYDAVIAGRSLNAVRGFKYAGLDSSGVFSFRDLNKDGKLDDSDLTVLGKLDATCFGGIENVFKWNRWEVSIFMEGKVQTGIVYQTAIYANTPPGSIIYGYLSNGTTEMVNRWRKPGDAALYQKLTMNENSDAYKAIGNYLGSSGVLTNASYLRLKTVSLYYHWNKYLLRKFGVQNGAFYIKGQNLFTLTPYKGADPENQSIVTMPPLRSIVVGLEVSF
jgi:TonB-linked SusC/RagA family outer membrane protein